MKIVAVIPCYNEAEFIADVVTKTKKHVEQVVVADDASTDKTSLVAHEAGALIYQNGIREGFGRNVMHGIETALSNCRPDIIVTLDGDGQHDPDDIPKVVQPILDGKADVVIGSRFLGKYEAPRYRKFGIDVITWLYNIGHKAKITDSQSCLRAYSRKIFEYVHICEDGFGFSTEIITKARKAGFSFTEVPITCIYHKEFASNSTMNPIKQGVTVALITIKWRLWGMVRGR